MMGCDEYKVTNDEKITQLNHEEKGIPYELHEHDIETRNSQKYVEIKHTNNYLDKRTTNETLLEISGDPSPSPVKGNESVPEGWKIRPDKNKTRTPY